MRRSELFFELLQREHSHGNCREEREFRGEFSHYMQAQARSRLRKRAKRLDFQWTSFSLSLRTYRSVSAGAESENCAK